MGIHIYQLDISGVCMWVCMVMVVTCMAIRCFKYRERDYTDVNCFTKVGLAEEMARK